MCLIFTIWVQRFSHLKEKVILFPNMPNCGQKGLQCIMNGKQDLLREVLYLNVFNKIKEA
jgi:hypothetical protein